MNLLPTKVLSQKLVLDVDVKSCSLRGFTELVVAVPPAAFARPPRTYTPLPATSQRNIATNYATAAYWLGKIGLNAGRELRILDASVDGVATTFERVAHPQTYDRARDDAAHAADAAENQRLLAKHTASTAKGGGGGGGDGGDAKTPVDVTTVKTEKEGGDDDDDDAVKLEDGGDGEKVASELEDLGMSDTRTLRVLDRFRNERQDMSELSGELAVAMPPAVAAAATHGDVDVSVRAVTLRVSFELVAPSHGFQFVNPTSSSSTFARRAPQAFATSPRGDASAWFPCVQYASKGAAVVDSFTLESRLCDFSCAVHSCSSLYTRCMQISRSMCNSTHTHTTVTAPSYLTVVASGRLVARELVDAAGAFATHLFASHAPLAPALVGVAVGCFRVVPGVSDAAVAAAARRVRSVGGGDDDDDDGGAATTKSELKSGDDASNDEDTIITFFCPAHTYNIDDDDVYTNCDDDGDGGGGDGGGGIGDSFYADDDDDDDADDAVDSDGSDNDDDGDDDDDVAVFARAAAAETNFAAPPLLNTTACVRPVLASIRRYLAVTALFPLPSLSIVFVDDAFDEAEPQVFVGIVIASTALLHAHTNVEQTYSTRRALAAAVARCVLLSSRHLSVRAAADGWIVDGLAAHLANEYLRSALGANAVAAARACRRAAVLRTDARPSQRDVTQAYTLARFLSSPAPPASECAELSFVSHSLAPAAFVNALGAGATASLLAASAGPEAAAAVADVNCFLPPELADPKTSVRLLDRFRPLAWAGYCHPR
jgi:hypothetical protein